MPNVSAAILARTRILDWPFTCNNSMRLVMFAEIQAVFSVWCHVVTSWVARNGDFGQESTFFSAGILLADALHRLRGGRVNYLIERIERNNLCPGSCLCSARAGVCDIYGLWRRKLRTVFCADCVVCARTGMRNIGDFNSLISRRVELCDGHVSAIDVVIAR
jgi:hypothetical protein